METTKTLSINELRQVISDTIDKVRKDKISVSRANAIEKQAGRYLTSVKLQMDYYRMLGTPPTMDHLFILPPKKKK